MSGPPQRGRAHALLSPVKDIKKKLDSGLDPRFTSVFLSKNPLNDYQEKFTADDDSIFI